MGFVQFPVHDVGHISDIFLEKLIISIIHWFNETPVHMKNNN